MDYRLQYLVMINRLHSLDFLRAFALLMGVLLHVLMLFLAPFDGSEPRLGASIIFIWIHTWRMPLFMLLAGFFTALSIQKRDVGNYALNRLIRLGVPILILWALIPEIDEGTNDHHGNVEQMLDAETQQPLTSHTNGPVPLVYVGGSGKEFTGEGSLCDLAPTLLSLLDLTIPAQMTGKDLLS